MEKVLVCILAQTRAHHLAWPSFKRHVLDELNADLALAVTLDEGYDYVNPYWQRAKYRWTSHQPTDIGDTFDVAQHWLWARKDVAPPDWRSILKMKGIWLGGIQGPNPQPSFSANLLFSRWLLLHGLQQDGILDRYDRFIVTRSDFVWLCPHPPMSILDRKSLWIPDGEHWGGLNDRHLVVSRDDVVAALNLIDDILLRPDELYEEMKLVRVQGHWNLEQFLELHLTKKGLRHRVEYFPYVMYLARPARDVRSRGGWSPNARYHPSVRHIVKYEEELQLARAYATVIKTRRDWEKGDWKTFKAPLPSDHHYPSPLERVWFKVSKVASALRRPGRLRTVRQYVRRRHPMDTEAQQQAKERVSRRG